MLLATRDPTVCFNAYGTQFGLIYVKHYFSVSLSTLKIPEILSWKSKKFLLKWQLEPSKKTLRHGLPVPGKNVLSQKLCDSKREKSIREEELELSENGAALRALPEFSVHEFCILGTRTLLTYCNVLVLLTQCNLWTGEIRCRGHQTPVWTRMKSGLPLKDNFKTTVQKEILKTWFKWFPRGIPWEFPWNKNHYAGSQPVARKMYRTDLSMGFLDFPYQSECREVQTPTLETQLL